MVSRQDENKPPLTTQKRLATTRVATSQKIRPQSPLVPLELLQSHRRGSVTDPHLHAVQVSNNIYPPTAPSVDAEMNKERSAERGSKRKASAELAGPGMNSQGDVPPAKRRRDEGWWASGEGGGGVVEGGGYVERGNGGVSGNMAFAWPSPSPGQAANTTMQQDNHDPNNVQPHIHPLEPNNPHPQLSMMSSIAFANDRRADITASAEPASGPSRSLRSRSRQPSRQLHGTEDPNASGPSSIDNAEDPLSAPSPGGTRQDSSGATPYSRSPELRVSHKLAERKRRKEMKDLFDELRDQLPADRGMKASKWEILSKAIDFVVQLKQSHQDMAREIDMMRHELDSVRGGVPPFGPGGPPHPGVYGQPPIVSQQYPPSAMPHPLPNPLSRPPSSQNMFPPGAGPSQQPPPPQQQPPPPQNTNGTVHHAESSPT